MLVGCIAGGMRARYKAPKGAGEMGRAARICRGSALLLHSAGMVIEKPPQQATEPSRFTPQV